MLEALEALPDSVDILTAEATEYSIPDHLKIHLNSGIEAVGASTGKVVQERTPEYSEYVHRELRANGCEYVQLENRADSKAAPSDSSTGDGGTAQSATVDTPIIGA